MTDVYCFAFVEDMPSAAVADRLVAARNARSKHRLVFRVAVREVESWILADHEAWAEYINIPGDNFSKTPDQLDDPKQHLLTVIRRKGKKKIHQEMLPKGAAHIGPLYNEVLCEFINTSWQPERAAENSPSLDRALKALMKI